MRGGEIGFQPPWYEAGALITNLSQKCKFCRVTPADLVCSTQLETDLSLRWLKSDLQGTVDRWHLFSAVSGPYRIKEANFKAVALQRQRNYCPYPCRCLHWHICSHHARAWIHQASRYLLTLFPLPLSSLFPSPSPAPHPLKLMWGQAMGKNN